MLFLRDSQKYKFSPGRWHYAVTMLAGAVPAFVKGIRVLFKRAQLAVGSLPTAGLSAVIGRQLSVRQSMLLAVAPGRLVVEWQQYVCSLH